MKNTEKVFTLNQYLQVIDNAYATGKANATIEEKEKMIQHIKYSAEEWAKAQENN